MGTQNLIVGRQGVIAAMLAAGSLEGSHFVLDGSTGPQLQLEVAHRVSRG
jgi:hypothetical protein